VRLDANISSSSPVKWKFDESKHRFGAGTALLAEDTTGQGHTMLIGDREPVIQAVIPLAETG
jgi:hypothetical protein